ncbi:DUF2623 family protein [Escherichia coli]|uniref:DUF2623 family protein n=1 Tax=Escherichia coli TaxID=562 RepID=UPI002028E617|nr:DUF2623 family protein [Escherichia coli]
MKTITYLSDTGCLEIQGASLRGFVLGYSHRMYEKTGDRQLSAWEAGFLTRRYGLDKEMVMDFFRENNSCSTLRFFMAGYRLEN